MFLYIKKEDFDCFRVELKNTFAGINAQIGMQMSKKEASNEFGEIRSYITNELEKYTKYKDFKNKDEEHVKSLGLIKEMLTEFKKTFVRLDNDNTAIKKLMADKADVVDLQTVIKL